MKRYTILTAVFTFVLFLLHTLLYFGQLGVPTESSRWIHETLLRKEAAAREVTKDRLLIISGSNALFSFSAQQITEETPMTAVNLGIHAGLKLEYILNRSLNLIQKGDVVLLPLEYELYSYDGRTSKTLADYATSRDPSWITRRFSTFVNTATSFNAAELSLRNLKRYMPDERRVGFYDAAYVNRFGDKTNIDLGKRTNADLQRLSDYAAVEVNLTHKSSEVIRHFVAKAVERGARVFLTFPVTMYFEEYLSEGFNEGIDKIRQLAISSNVEVLGSPSDFFLPMELFYDTNYHAGPEGRTIATTKLITLMQKSSIVASESKTCSRTVQR